MEVRSGHRIYILAGICLSIFLIILSVTIATQTTSTIGRANTTNQSGLANLSVENSYVFASPVAADANGSSIIRITVFLLSTQGLGLSGVKVDLTYDGPVRISQNEPTSDTLGRATFDLISNTAGDYTISASVGGVKIPQTVSISFR